MVLLERRDGARLGPALSGVFFVFREVFMSAPQHITVVDYNPAWPELFAAERDLIAPVCGAQCHRHYAHRRRGGHDAPGRGDAWRRARATVRRLSRAHDAARR